MRRSFLLGLALSLGLLVPAFCQEKGGGEASQGNIEIWRWANFLILAGGLGYLIGKNAGPFFAARSQKIREEMTEAEATRKQAEQRAADVDRRLAGLQAEIEALRTESQKEAASEQERMRQQTIAEIAKIRVHAQQEIVAAGKTARAELKRHSAELAIGLARQKLQARITPETQDALVRGFVRDLDSPSSQAQAN